MILVTSPERKFGNFALNLPRRGRNRSAQGRAERYSAQRRPGLGRIRSPQALKGRYNGRRLRPFRARVPSGRLSQGGAARSTAPLCPGLFCCRTFGANSKAQLQNLRSGQVEIFINLRTRTRCSPAAHDHTAAMPRRSAPTPKIRVLSAPAPPSPVGRTAAHTLGECALHRSAPTSIA